MLELRGIRKSFGDRDILQSVNLQISERQRVAVVGENGAGKSTLLKIALGEIEPDGGTRRLAPWASVAYLPQDARCAASHSLEEELFTAFAHLRELENRQRLLEEEMHALASDDPRLMALVTEHSHLQEEFERLNGYTIETEIGKVLAGLGFSFSDRSKRACDFSGGWQMRIALAKLLLRRPSLLLLDEPTNHLDLGAISWLEDYLREYRGAVLVVSHDRYFLDRVTQRTLELDNGIIYEWSGNYSSFVTEKAKALAAEEAAYKRQQEFIADQQAFIERFRASARRSAQAKSREHAIEKLDLIPPPRRANSTGRFRFAAYHPSGREVFTLKGIAKAYDSHTVFTDCNLLVERGDKIALVGENGAGKTTLLRILAGLERPDRGAVRLGMNVQRGYYAQHQADSLDEGHTIFEEVYQAAPPNWTKGDVRSLLGRFRISDDDVFKSIKVLSGGERSRIALAKMLLRPANVLLFDEPTNHLDIPAREMLEDALRSYEGTVIVVSHDRYFIDKVATKVVEIAAETAKVYGGNYSYYLARKAIEAEAAIKLEGEQAGPQRRDSRRIAVHRSISPAKQLATLENEICALETELRRLAADLAAPEHYADAERPATLLAQYQDAEKRLAELNASWETLARAVEEAG